MQRIAQTMATIGKYIKFLFFLGVISLVVYLILNKEIKIDNQKNGSKVYKVAVNMKSFVPPIDPQNNTTLVNAFFNNHMYSNLIEVNNKNEYEVGLATAVSWSKDSVIFSFDGTELATAEDALFSLHRVMLKNSNLHSDLWSIICSKEENRDECIKRVYVEDRKLVIKFADALKKHLILPTLASIDYKIAPKSAFDSEDPTIAKLTDYTNTTGAYFLENKNGSHIFYRNTKFKKHLNEIKSFELIDTDFNNLEERILKNEVDIVPSFLNMNRDFFSEHIKNKWNFFESHPLSISTIVFSKEMMKKSTDVERFSIGHEVVTDLNTRAINGSTLAYEYFQSFGQGHLNAEQKEYILNKRKSSISSFPTSKLKMGVTRSHLWEAFVKKFPNVELVVMDFSKPFYNQDIDFYMIVNDVSFDLNFSLLAYAAKTGLLDMDQEDLDTFINISTEEERIEFINKIHFRTLKKAQIYPIWASPYYTCTRKPLVAELSKFNSRTLLWKIRER